MIDQKLSNFIYNKLNLIYSIEIVITKVQYLLILELYLIGNFVKV
jgi:hypothetical protein